MSKDRRHLIFINYRRSDTSPNARALFRNLKTLFGAESVFLDTTSIDPGAIWPTQLNDHLHAASVLLAVIGPGWLLAADEYGRRRLDIPGDWVHDEIAYAINNDLEIIPILMDGARNVDKKGLPEAIAKLADYQAINVDYAQWDNDLNLLIKRLERLGFQHIGSETNIEAKIERLRDLERQQAQNALNLYIEPQGKHPGQKETLYLSDQFLRFLEADDKKVLLLLGDAGAGKSTFSHALTKSLWDAYAIDRPIPLYIHLPKIKNPTWKLIEQYLDGKGFSDPQIQNLKHTRRFVFILDGYDEIRTELNLYNDNRLVEWNAKVVISCRTEYLGKDYRKRFEPLDRNNPGDSSQFEELVIAPFSPEQINRYITNYVKCLPACGQVPNWDVAQYQHALSQLPDLEESLLSNPFILSFTLTILPTLSTQLNQGHLVSRWDLYDAYIRIWFERAQTRLQEIRRRLSLDEKEAIVDLEDFDFIQYCIKFAVDLAVEMYETSSVVVEYPLPNQNKSSTCIGQWQNFFGTKAHIRLLLRSCPLYRSGNQYGFLHKSLQEYFVARSVYEPSLVKDSWNEDAAEQTSFGGKESLLMRKRIKESSIMQFLSQRAQREQLFKQRLHDIIDRSKSDNASDIATVNAIAILVIAKVPFNGANVRLTSLELTGCK